MGMRAQMLLGTRVGRGDGVAPSTLQGGSFPIGTSPKPQEKLVSLLASCDSVWAFPAAFPKALPSSLPGHCLHPSPGIPLYPSPGIPLHPRLGRASFPPRALPASFPGITACIPA